MSVFVLDNIPEAVIYYENDGRVVYLNRAAGESVGIAEGEFVEGCLCELPVALSEGRCFLDTAIIKKIGEGGQMHKGRLTTPDGRDWHTRVYPVRDGEGEIVGVVEIRSESLPLQDSGEKTEDVHGILSALLSFRDMERRRISHQLDTLSQILSAVKFVIEGANDFLEKKDIDKAIKALGSIIPLIQKTTEESKELELELYPSQLEALGLIPTLKWFCRRFQRAHSEIGVETRVSVSESEIPASLKLVIYRVLEEIMSNIVLNGRAEGVVISLDASGSRVELVVTEKTGDREDTTIAQETKGCLSSQYLELAQKRISLSRGFLAVDLSELNGRTFRASWPVT